MKKITLAIIVLSVILVGACLVSAHSPERPLPGPHDAAIDSIYASGVTHPQGSDIDWIWSCHQFSTIFWIRCPTFMINLL